MTHAPQSPPLSIAPWREKFVETPEVRLRYLEWGDPSKAPLLLLHGVGQTAHTWAYFATAMQHHYRVIAVEQRGHGDSGWAPDGDYSPAAHGRDLSAFIEQLKLESFALLGFSMGGRNAMWLTDRHPTKVRCLVIVDAGPERPSPGGSQARRFMSGPDVLGSIEDFVERAILDEVEFEYLYSDGDGYHFMNSQTYEQIPLQRDLLGDAAEYLIPNLAVKVEFYEGKPIGVLLPDTVDLTVVETEPSIQKATASAVMKPAKLETGLVINVPPFVGNGDKVRVDTSEARYVQRVQ